MSKVQHTFASAVTAHRAGKLAEAERLYRQVLAADRRHLDSLRMLGLLAQAAGKNDEAVQLIREAIGFHPRSAEAWSDLADVHAEAGRSAEALEAYRKAMDISPYHARARNNLGDLLHRLERSAEAVAYWHEAIRLDPTLPEPYCNIGRALIAEGKLEEAEQIYRRAIAAQPNYAPAHNNLAGILWKAGRKKESSESLCRALQINPNNAEAWFNLGLAWDEAGKSDEAMGCWRKAIGINPDYAEAHQNLGEALDRKGDRLGAIREWEETLRLRPDWEALKFYLAAAKATDAPQPTVPPPAYIATLFDGYAEQFDQHLVKTLEYRVPQSLLEAAKRTGRERFDVVVDAGCGTGLCGEVFRPIAGRLVGVDVAPKMIEKSRQRGVYDELILGRLEDALRARSEVDLILAADVLNYVGELKAVFDAVGAALWQEGYFLFSIEKPTSEEGEGLILRRTRRYAHSRGYIERLARDAGMELVETTDAVIRMDHGKPLEGYIGVVRKI